MTDTALAGLPPDGRAGAQNPFKRILSNMARQHRLLSLHWEMTYRCNEVCTHCYLDVFKPNARVAGELSLAQGMRLLDDAANLGALNLTLSGGEALVHQDFFALASYARRKRFALRLLSNGLLINEHVADRIAQLKPTGVEISIYGADPETHDAVTRRRRSWELTTRACRLLHERGIHTVLKTPLMHSNVRQIHALRGLASELGAVFRFDTTLTPKDNGDHGPLRHEMTDDDLAWLLREGIPSGYEQPPALGAAHRSCSIGMHSLVVDPYGNVFPCIQVRIPAGNVQDRPLAEVWQSAIFAETSSLTFDELPICRTCELNMICVRCHGTALESTGDLRAPSPSNCRETLVRRQVLIEKGVLPVDYPIPFHLRHGVPETLVGLAAASAVRSAPAGGFIPIDKLTTRPASAMAPA